MSTTSTDPIADMLSRIRNAIAVRKNEVTLPHSKIKENVARILKDSNFVDRVEVVENEGAFKSLKITINTSDSNARITEIVRLSKPGRRSYAKAGAIPAVKRGRGMVIVSTSKGIMTDQDARNQKLGGELICKVY